MRPRAVGINKLGYTYMETPPDKPIRENHLWLALAVIGALLFVVGASYVAVWHHQWLSLPNDQHLDARGNVLAAFFSGLAFVGVVAAIILQWKELGYQREELRQTKEAMQKSAATQEDQTRELREQTQLLRDQVAEQIAESRETALAQKRQSREQFLTARLNAHAAQLHAYEARANADPSPDELGYLQREIRSLAIDAAVLKCESSLGFDSEPWKPEIERRAIRLYLEERFRDIHNRFEELSPGFRRGMGLVAIGHIEIELTELSTRIWSRHPDIAQILNNIVERIPKHPSMTPHHRDLPAEIEQWIDFHLTTTLQQSRPPWTLSPSSEPMEGK